jgi:hypothetical protein
MRDALEFDGVEPSPKVTFPVRFAGLVLSLDAYTLAHESGEAIPLTRGEFALLRMFVTRPGRVIGRDTLLDALTNRRFEPPDARCRRPQRSTEALSSSASIPLRNQKSVLTYLSTGRLLVARRVAGELSIERRNEDGRSFRLTAHNPRRELPHGKIFSFESLAMH